METSERRNDQQRIDVSRPIELISMEGDAGSTGYTKNLSADGVRAWFDETPDRCANVLVRLSLVDGREPVDKPGRIVWCAPDIFGEGTDVGIQLIDDLPTTAPEPPPEERGDRPPILPAPELARGQSVQIAAGGITVEARIEAIGEIDDDGRITVRLALTEEQLAPESENPPADADPGFDAEEWTPHPFRDAWRATRRFLGPLLTALSVVGHFGGRLCAWLWRKLPARPRTRVEVLWRKIALPDRARALTVRLGAVRGWFARQLASWRAGRAAKRSGETGA